MLKGPLTLLEGVLVSIFSWVAMRTDMVRSATCLPLSLCSHLCAVKLGLLEVSENSSPPPRQPPPLPLPSPTAKRKDDLGVREPSENASLSTRRVNQSQTLASFPKRGAEGGGGRGGGTGSSKRYLSLPPLLPPSLARSLPQLLHTNMLKLSRQDFTQQRWSWIV